MHFYSPFFLNPVSISTGNRSHNNVDPSIAQACDVLRADSLNLAYDIFNGFIWDLVSLFFAQGCVRAHSPVNHKRGIFLVASLPPTYSPVAFAHLRT